MNDKDPSNADVVHNLVALYGMIQDLAVARSLRFGGAPVDQQDCQDAQTFIHQMVKVVQSNGIDLTALNGEPVTRFSISPLTQDRR